MQGKIPKSAITEKQLRKKIKEASKDHSSMTAWAVENGLTPQQLTAFIRRTQSAGLKIPEVLGYRPQTIYLPLKEELISHMNPPRKVVANPSKKVDHSLPPIEKKNAKKKDDRKETKKRLKKRKK